MTDESTDYGFGEPAEPAPAAEPASEPAPAAAQPPDIGEAIGQLRQFEDRLQQIEQQQVAEPEPGYEEGYGDPAYDQGYGEGYGVDPAYDLDPDDPQAFAATVQRVADESAREAVAGVQADYQARANEDAILAFADQHPAIREPEVLKEVIGRLDALGLSQSDPNAVSMAYLATEAARAGLAQPGPQQPAEQRGITLETGAGARPGEAPEVDPQTAAYAQALSGRPTPNRFGL